MTPTYRNPLAVFAEVASSFAGRFFLFGLSLVFGATAGCSLGFEKLCGPVEGFTTFGGSFFKSVIAGGWGLLVFPILLLCFVLYLRYELSHHLLWIPGLVSLAHAWKYSWDLSQSFWFSW